MMNQMGGESSIAYRPEEGAPDQASRAVGGEVPFSTSFTVRRERLLKDILTRARTVGATVVVGPSGFGKTGLLLQYVEEVRSDPRRGTARLIKADGLELDELLVELQQTEQALSFAENPLIAIDDVGMYGEEGTAALVERLRSLREGGIELIVASKPANRLFIQGFGDSIKISPQALRVQPREYSEWARVFSLPAAIDVYGLTQGVPSLIAALYGVDAAPGGRLSLLDVGTVDVYRSVLADLKLEAPGLVTLAEVMLLAGSGSFVSWGRAGFAVDHEAVSILVHDYPVFGIDVAAGSFCCLGCGRASQRRIVEIISATDELIVPRTVRMLLRAGQVDRAAELMDQVVDTPTAASLLAQFPLTLTLAGHVQLVMRVLDEAKGLDAVPELGDVLAAYGAALVEGNLKTARQEAGELSRRANEVAQEIDPVDWERAGALAATWRFSKGVDLPELPQSFTEGVDDRDARLLRLHVAVREALLARTPIPEDVQREARAASLAGGVADVLIVTDAMLAEALTGEMEGVDARDKQLEGMLEDLRTRGLGPLVVHARLTLAARRLMAGVPVVDERAFVDAGTAAIRASNHAGQLLSMLLEGWGQMMVGQMVNAQFRGQQVMGLAEDGQVLLKDWAYLLDRTAHLRTTSRVSIREEAELLDLGRQDVSWAEAWAVALCLSSARFDAELAAWFSLHRTLLLDPATHLMVRLAMEALGDRADSIRRLMTAPMLAAYSFERPEGAPRVVAPRSWSAPVAVEDEQVDIRLFGGFTVRRGGHVMTEELWKRKKTSILAARLVLAMGSFVSRRTLASELWPGYDYARARRSLYTTLSALRLAFGQRKTGPQYILTQGDGVSINREYVSSDVAVFERLSREVLLGKGELSAPQVKEMCLKIEQIYVDPLYVPDRVDTKYFFRAQRVLQSKYIDCMLRGVSVAVEEEDIPAATWMAEAAIRREPTREDVLRCTMRVYELGGRRRELIDLYNGYLSYLQEHAKGVPDPETRALFEELVGRQRMRSMS